MSTNRNSGIIISGGTVNAGALAVGPDAHAQNVSGHSLGDCEEVVSTALRPVDAHRSEGAAGVTTVGYDEDLHALLGELFADPSRADHLLDRISFPRGRRPSRDHYSPADWWYEVLREMQKGAVENPVRRLVTAALDWYPHNPNLLHFLSLDPPNNV